MLNWIIVGGDNTGYGNQAVQMIVALRRKGIKALPVSNEAILWPYQIQQAAGFDKANVTIANIAPYHLARPLPGRTFLFTMYETDQLPPGWVKRIHEHAERVFVPSPYCKAVFEANGVKVPVHVIPLGLDPYEFPMVDWAQRPERPFTFVSIGDKHLRKGADIFWKAFHLAFGDYAQTHDVRLLLKVMPGPNNLFAHMDPTESDPRIVIWHEDVPDIAEVYHRADCFVFPSRGEGWGLPPREAAACGVPTIATDHSGLQVGLEQWGWPLDVAHMSPSPMPGEGKWAEPDADHLATLMKMMVEKQAETRNQAATHAQWLREHQTWDHAADVLLEVLEEVGVAGLQRLSE